MIAFFALLIGPQGGPLPVKVNKLTSIKTQLLYTYYSLPFCKPDAIVDSAENLGEVLRGDRIENSPYVVSTIYNITD
jgi:transmembrane 9 superfamily member 2/4